VLVQIVTKKVSVKILLCAKLVMIIGYLAVPVALKNFLTPEGFPFKI
jgi:hypothetical protein